MLRFCVYGLKITVFIKVAQILLRYHFTDDLTEKLGAILCRGVSRGIYRKGDMSIGA